MLPELRTAIARLKTKFPGVQLRLMDGRVGELTEYDGYHVGIDCDLQSAVQPRSLVLEVSVRQAHHATATIDCAHVAWGHPDAHIETELVDAPIQFTSAAIDRLKGGLHTLLASLEAALHRGRPSA